MKSLKKVVYLSFITVLSLVFTSCLSVGQTNFSYYERGLDRTPENSVIFYGMYYGANEMRYSQDDFNYSPDSQVFTGRLGVIVSAPVEPGSHYHLEHVKVQVITYQVGNYREIATIDSDIPKNYKGLDIQVPSEPGLYYIGWWEVVKTVQNGENTPFSGDEAFCWDLTQEEGEIEVLGAAKKAYKGTSWEAVIDERLNELNAGDK